MDKLSEHNQQPLHTKVLEWITDMGYWNTFPSYPRIYWMDEVANRNTLQSYHQWVSSKLEKEEHESSS